MKRGIPRYASDLSIEATSHHLITIPIVYTSREAYCEGRKQKMACFSGVTKSKPEKGQSLGPLVRKEGHLLIGDALPFWVSE